MLFYRKNVGGEWQIKKLTPEEAKKVQEKIIRMGLSLNKNMQEMIKAAGLTVSDEVMAAIIDKAVPSYDSLANDVIESDIAGKPISS